MTHGRQSPLRRVTLFALMWAGLAIGSGCGRPPQVVDNEECFAAVDALWTAVTSKRGDLLERTATELDRLHRAGTLSDDGHEALAVIIQQGRVAEWQPAAEKLKKFMLGQRKARP